MNCSFKILVIPTFLIFLCLSFGSCEQIIDLNLQQASPKVVIEGCVTSGKGPFIVKISQSQSYFDQSSFTGIEKANVEISDSKFREKLKNNGGGYYSTTQIRGMENFRFFQSSDQVK